MAVEKLEVLADKGYYEAECLKVCVENKIRPYVSKQKRANRTGDEVFYTYRFKYEYWRYRSGSLLRNYMNNEVI
jgi:hypothetical protein